MRTRSSPAAARDVTVFAIRNARDHRRALREIEALMDARRGTPEGDRLDVLATLVEAYELVHEPMPLPDPIAAIRFHMEQNGLTAADLTPFIGSRNRVYEILNRRRPPHLAYGVAAAYRLGHARRIVDPGRPNVRAKAAATARGGVGLPNRHAAVARCRIFRAGRRQGWPPSLAMTDREHP